MSRHITGIKQAWTLQETPVPAWERQRKRLKGVRGRGLRFERAVGRWLVRAGHLPKLGQWYRFIDKNGPGTAQTDIELHFPTHVLLLECKLSYNLEAYKQLEDLYMPILSMVYDKPVVGIQVVKFISPRAVSGVQIVDSLEPYMSQSRQSSRLVYQHLL